MYITKIINFFHKKLTNEREQSDDAFSLVEKEEIIASETAVALVYNGISHAVMMCTSENLEDFAIGFSLTEGIINKASDIYGIDIVENCNGIEVHIEIATRCFVQLKEHRRNLTGRTGCGICGAEQLEQVNKKLPILDRTLQIDLRNLSNCLAQLQSAQQLGQKTGATHAAAFFDEQGNMLAIREDVGRHVALDKLLGWHIRAGSPKGFVYVTSRASYEMVQKCVSAGVELLVAISAATDLAVTMAEQHDLSLLGFARQDKATIYTGKERLIF